MLIPSLLLMLAHPAAAQEPVAETVSAQQSEGAALYAELAAEYDAAYAAWMENIQALFAEAEASGEPLTEYPPQPAAEFLDRFQTGADQFAGTDDAVPFLVWLVQNALYHEDGQGKKALKAIVASHLASAHLEPMGPLLGNFDYVLGEGEGAKIAAKIEKVTPSKSLRAWATFTRLQPVFNNNGPKSEAFLGAKAEMKKAMDGVEDPWLKRQYDSTVTVLETFGIGMTAPDIVGPDLDGVVFSLTDYKGKVIFLDFWGDW